MAKHYYNLTCPVDNVRIVDGVVTITFERETPVSESFDAEESGELQSDMLWEGFEHSFRTEIDFVEVNFDPNTGQMIHDVKGKRVAKEEFTGIVTNVHLISLDGKDTEVYEVNWDVGRDAMFIPMAYRDEKGTSKKGYLPSELELI